MGHRVTPTNFVSQCDLFQNLCVYSNNMDKQDVVPCMVSLLNYHGEIKESERGVKNLQKKKDFTRQYKET